MLHKLTPLMFCAAVWSHSVWAEVPSVVADIPPVQSLVAQVMGDLGEVQGFLPPSADAHAVSLRPSDAAVLADADLVVWMGKALMPQLPGMIATLAPDAQDLPLMTVAGSVALPMREFDDFDGDHDHNHEHDDHDDHSEENHDGIDPHGWLDPENARLWLSSIAATLSEMDPDNAETYQENALRARADIADAASRIANTLDALPTKVFATSHDAFQYFEDHFGLTSVTTVSLANGNKPGPRQLFEIQTVLRDAGVTCILVDLNESTALLDPLRKTAETKIAIVDPLGRDLQPGAGMYNRLLDGISNALAECLSD